MKKRFNLTFLFVIAASLTISTLSGCVSKGCTDPASDNYDISADQNDGSCILSRLKFLSKYNVAEACPSGNGSYEITISDSTINSNEVLIKNFGDLGASITATISTTNITISNQVVSVGAFAVTVSGAGTLNGELLTISYTYTILGQSETCSMNCAKQ